MDGSDGLITYRGKAMGLNKPYPWAWKGTGKTEIWENKGQIKRATYKMFLLPRLPMDGIDPAYFINLFI